MNAPNGDQWMPVPTRLVRAVLNASNPIKRGWAIAYLIAWILKFWCTSQGDRATVDSLCDWTGDGNRRRMNTARKDAFGWHTLWEQEIQRARRRRQGLEATPDQEPPAEEDVEASEPEPEAAEPEPASPPAARAVPRQAGDTDSIRDRHGSDTDLIRDKAVKPGTVGELRYDSDTAAIRNRHDRARLPSTNTSTAIGLQVPEPARVGADPEPAVDASPPAAALAVAGDWAPIIDPHSVSVLQAGLPDEIADPLYRLGLHTLGEVCGEMRSQLAGGLTRQGILRRGTIARALDRLEAELRDRWGLALLTPAQMAQRRAQRQQRRAPALAVYQGGRRPPPPGEDLPGLNILGESLGLDQLYADCPVYVGAK